MRKEYGKALRTLFSKQMAKQLSQFEEIKINSIYFSPGDRAFRWKAADRLHCWIVLSPSKKDHDEFTVLIGWSKLGRYPELGMVPCAQMPTRFGDEFENEEYLTRLPYLWTDEDRWWVVKEFRPPSSLAEMQKDLEPVPAREAREAVAPLVHDAMEKIGKMGLPYLEAMSRQVRSRQCEQARKES